MSTRASTGSTLGGLARARAAFQKRTIATVVGSNPTKDYSDRDLRDIRAASTHAELDAYEAAAKLRGIEPHELSAIYEHRRALTKRGVRT